MRVLLLLLALAESASAQAGGGITAPSPIVCGNQTEVPGLVVESLGLKPGMTVVEIGTGDGYMLRDLGQAVGPAGRVIGEDIGIAGMEAAKARVAREKLTNVSLILGGFTDPKLPLGIADVVFVHSRYESLDAPAKMLSAFAVALKSDGRLVIVEHHKDVCTKRSWEDISNEVTSNGYRRRYRMERITSRQYMLVFAKR